MEPSPTTTVLIPPQSAKLCRSSRRLLRDSASLPRASATAEMFPRCFNVAKAALCCAINTSTACT